MAHKRVSDRNTDGSRLHSDRTFFDLRNSRPVSIVSSCARRTPAGMVSGGVNEASCTPRVTLIAIQGGDKVKIRLRDEASMRSRYESRWWPEAERIEEAGVGAAGKALERSQMRRSCPRCQNDGRRRSRLARDGRVVPPLRSLSLVSVIVN